MTKRRIHISNLTVRLPRSAGHLMSDPRKLASDVGQEIVKHIAEATQGHSGTLRIDRLSSGKIRIGRHAGAMHTQIGKQVASKVMKILDGGER